MDIVTISNEAAWHAIQNYYFNCVCDVSRHVGSVVHALEQAGLADNTIIVYTADHGEAAGAHRMKEKIGTIYKEMMQVLFVVVHPDSSGAARRRHFRARWISCQRCLHSLVCRQTKSHQTSRS